MPKVRFGENGEVLDDSTGKRIGKMVDGRVSLDENKDLKVISISSENSFKENQAAEKGDFIASGASSVHSHDNIGAMEENAMASNSEPPLASVHVRKPSCFEVTPNSSFSIAFGIFERDERWICIPEELVRDNPMSMAIKVKFRMWSYEEELAWRSECNRFSSEARTLILDQDKFNEIKIRRLLLDWSFGEIEPEMRMLHVDGVLSDESYNIFKSLYPSIANTIVNLMNSVLEMNQ